MEALILGIGIILLPVYSFDSGGAQFAHMALGLFILLRLTALQWKVNWHETFLILLILVIFAREGAAVMVEAPVSSLMPAVYLAFNSLLVLVFTRIPFQTKGYRTAFKISLALSVAVAAGAVLYYGATWTMDEGLLTRSIGTFNNPNQLGYYAVCIFSITALFYMRGLVSGVMCLALWGAAFALVVASLSRGAIIAFVPALLLGLAAMLNRGRLSPVIIIVSTILFTAVAALYASGEFDHFQFVQRMEATGSDRYDGLTDRGYVFFFRDPLELLFGLGELQVKARLNGIHEVHSTFWSFMVTYGVIGFILFMGVWLIWSRVIYRDFGFLGLLLVVMPPSVYGLTHNGSRFTLLWILIALSFNPSLRLWKTGAAHEPPLGAARARPSTLAVGRRPTGALGA